MWRESDAADLPFVGSPAKRPARFHLPISRARRSEGHCRHISAPSVLLDAAAVHGPFMMKLGLGLTGVGVVGSVLFFLIGRPQTQ